MGKMINEKKKKKEKGASCQLKVHTVMITKERGLPYFEFPRGGKCPFLPPPPAGAHEPIYHWKL